MNMMEEGASLVNRNGVHPLFTQPHMEDEDSSTNMDTNNKDDDGACDTNNDIDDMDDNDEEGSSANGPIFEVDEEDNMDSRVDQNDDDDDDDDDGFKLLTQANDRFNETVDGVDSSSSDESSSDDSDSSGSSSDDDDSESSSSTGEKAMKNEKVETPLQERRARNMRRNKAFVDNLKLELNAMMNQGIDGGHKSSKRKRLVAAKDEESVTLKQDVDEKDAPIERRKRRGMIFSTTSNKRHNKSPQQIPLPLTTKSLVDELNPKYPHRSNQIHILCSQLVSIVQKSKFAWQMKDNIRSLGNIQYSEASYQGDIKLATPSPIMITGNGGNGKTCIVRDAMKALQQRTNCGNVFPAVANAYIDCASSESGSVAAVMNSAYKQLHECYHSNSGFGRDEKVELKGYKHHSSAGITRSTLGGENDFTEDVVESDAADDESLGEDQLERQRSRAQKMKETAGRNGKRSKHNTKANGNATKVNSNNTQNVRQTRLRTTLATKADQPTSQSIGLNSGSIPSATNRNTQNSGSVALFGRATSALIQAGNTTRKRTSNNNWRCVFLILDNAERILSWKKHGSINPLTQIFLLPSVMGINLTLIFISRSTIFQHSPVHNPPGSLLDAIHPQTIHFNSYTSVETMKSIFNVPHVQQSIIGRSSLTSHAFLCNNANQLRSKLNDWLYASMMNSFIPSVVSSTHDMTEITRLARLLWPEYVAPLDRRNGCDDPALESLIWRVLCCICPDAAEQCEDSHCSFCENLHVAADNVVDSVVDLNELKKRLSEKLDRNIRESMRSLLSSTIMMPGRVLMKQNYHPYAGRLPYITKFLLLAAFLCQNKRSEQDRNLFTTVNTGKSKRRRTNKDGDETAYAASSKDTTQRQPSFPLERMLSVFYSIIDQYGQQHYMTYKEGGVSISAQLGTQHLFQNISQLIATGLLCTVGSVKFNEKYNQDLMEMTTAKFSCMISRDDARIIASTVGFPLERYCP